MTNGRINQGPNHAQSNESVIISSQPGIEGHQLTHGCCTNQEKPRCQAWTEAQQQVPTPPKTQPQFQKLARWTPPPLRVSRAKESNNRANGYRGNWLYPIKSFATPTENRCNESNKATMPQKLQCTCIQSPGKLTPPSILTRYSPFAFNNFCGFFRFLLLNWDWGGFIHRVDLGSFGCNYFIRYIGCVTFRRGFQ